MKQIFLVAVAISFLVPMGLARENDGNFFPSRPQCIQTARESSMTSRAPGNVNWVLDVGTPTGDSRLLGVEFDGTHFWLTGANDFTCAYLYEISPDGTLVNTYPQPSPCWGSWGWRDLIYDGSYLYASSDTDHASMITQIDTATGTPTGTYYGPYPLNPCRALAYDPIEDCFWTASFSSSLYKCFKDGSSASFTNPGLAMYGAAHCPDGIWWWSQDGNGSLCSLMKTDGSFTGDTFDGDLSMGGGIAGGAGAYDLGGDNWEMVGMHQGTPDYIAGYDINMDHDFLEIHPGEVSAFYGGTVNFDLYGGTDNAFKKYCILGTFYGTSPGTSLPGGLNLPINWDWFSDFLVSMAINGGLGIVNDFLGTLDAEGNATASLVFPGHCHLYMDLLANFAWCTYAPFDFVSNDVELWVLGYLVDPEYYYDDTSAENIVGYTQGGDVCWVNWFEVIPGFETISEVGSGFGSSTYVGYGMSNGDPATIYIWEAPGGDNDLTTGVLLDTVSVTVQNVDMDYINWYALNGPQTISTAGFFVGCMVTHPPSAYVYPMDESSLPTGGQSWLLGNQTSTGPLDPANPGANDSCDPMKDIALDCYAIVRAKN